MAQSVDSRRAGASPTGGGGSVKHCTWSWVKREAEEKGHREGWRRRPGFLLHSHPPSPATTTPSGSHPRRKCGILDSRNMNVTVCHSCSHAPGVPGKPRQTPRVEAVHAPLAWPLPPLRTLSCKTHNGEVSAPRSPRSSRAHILAAEALPRASARGNMPPPSTSGSLVLRLHLVLI